MGFEIPIDVDYFDHPKTMKLIGILRNQEADIYPLRLWRYAAKYARDGVIKGGSAEIESAVRWRGQPGRLSSALIQVGFVESDGRTIHDWKRGIGRAIFLYEEKKRKQREKYAEEHGILPEEPGRIPPILDRRGEDRIGEDTQEGRGDGAAAPPPPPLLEGLRQAQAEAAVTVAAFAAWKHPSDEKKLEGVLEMRNMGLSHEYIRAAADPELNTPSTTGFWDIVKALKAGHNMKRGNGKAVLPQAAPPVRENATAYIRTEKKDSTTERQRLDDARKRADDAIAGLAPDIFAQWKADATIAADNAGIKFGRDAWVVSHLRTRAGKEFGIEGI